jgi:cobalt-zinc-cadmium efflux system outer membrane protein
MWTRERTKDEPDPTETEHIVGLKVSIPLPLWNRNEGRIAEAAAAAERARREVDALALNASAEANAARQEMVALGKLLAALDGQLLPKSAEIEERLRQLYSTGQSPLLEVLRARTRTLELQQQRLDALRDYHLARVRLAAATARNH